MITTIVGVLCLLTGFAIGICIFVNTEGEKQFEYYGAMEALNKFEEMSKRDLICEIRFNSHTKRYEIWIVGIKKPLFENWA